MVREVLALSSGTKDALQHSNFSSAATSPFAETMQPTNPEPSTTKQNLILHSCDFQLGGQPSHAAPLKPADGTSRALQSDRFAAGQAGIVLASACTKASDFLGSISVFEPCSQDDSDRQAPLTAFSLYMACIAVGP